VKCSPAFASSHCILQNSSLSYDLLSHSLPCFPLVKSIYSNIRVIALVLRTTPMIRSNTSVDSLNVIFSYLNLIHTNRFATADMLDISSSLYLVLHSEEKDVASVGVLNLKAFAGVYVGRVYLTEREMCVGTSSPVRSFSSSNSNSTTGDGRTNSNANRSKWPVL
jgi:hypothetical protein